MKLVLLCMITCLWSKENTFFKLEHVFGWFCEWNPNGRKTEQRFWACVARPELARASEGTRQSSPVLASQPSALWLDSLRRELARDSEKPLTCLAMARASERWRRQPDLVDFNWWWWINTWIVSSLWMCIIDDSIFICLLVMMMLTTRWIEYKCMCVSMYMW